MKRQHVADLYLKVFGTRGRSFRSYGDHVLAVDDSGGFVVCDMGNVDEGMAVLIVELLNEARDRAGVEKQS